MKLASPWLFVMLCHVNLFALQHTKYVLPPFIFVGRIFFCTNINAKPAGSKRCSPHATAAHVDRVIARAGGGAGARYLGKRQKKL